MSRFGVLAGRQPCAAGLAVTLQASVPPFQTYYAKNLIYARDPATTLNTRGFHSSNAARDTLYKPIVPISRIQWYKLQAKIAVLKRRLGDKYAIIGRDKRRSPYSPRPHKFDFSRADKPHEPTPEITLLLARQGYTCPLPIVPGDIAETLKIAGLVAPFVESQKQVLKDAEEERIRSKGTKMYDDSGVEKTEEAFEPYTLPVTDPVDPTTSILSKTSQEEEKVQLPNAYLSRAITVEAERSLEDKVARAVAQMHFDVFDTNSTLEIEQDAQVSDPSMKKQQIESKRTTTSLRRDGLSSAPYFLDGITPEDLDILVNKIPTVEAHFDLNTDKSLQAKAQSAEIAKRMFTLDNANQEQINKFNRQRMILLFGGDLQNSGDTAAQAAIVSLSIMRIKEHIETRKRDPKILDALQRLIGKRERLLKYLRKQDLQKYILTCRALGVTPKGTI